MIPDHVFQQTILQFFEPIAPLLADPGVSEIVINGPHEILIERKGRMERTTAQFAGQEQLLAAIRHLAQYTGRHVDETNPILEGRLPDGSRVEAILPPAGPGGPFVAIRRFTRDTLSIDQLVATGSLTRESADLLRAMVMAKLNVLVAGGTGSGKTSLLNVLSSFIPDGDRVISIEDARELQLRGSHIVPLEARPPDPYGKGEVTIRALFRATLRMRPDRIIIGEIRGGEALDLVQAMTSGHGGCMSTLHATYPTDALNRLETMALMSDVELPLDALRAQIGSAINVIVQTSRLQDGSRCVTHITEVAGYDPKTGYVLNNVALRTFHGKDAQGNIQSRLEPTGVRVHATEAVNALGLSLPPSFAKP